MKLSKYVSSGTLSEFMTFKKRSVKHQRICIVIQMCTITVIVKSIFVFLLLSVVKYDKTNIMFVFAGSFLQNRISFTNS